MQARLKLVKAGNPLDPETMIGSQVSKHNAIKSLTISILVKKKVQLAIGGAGNHEGDLVEDTISTNSVERNK
jgi:aldehyde dehydrogenase (NAD+)/aldehyde dehydrogenase